MPILLWLARFVGSTVTLVVNLALSSGLFLLSAYLFTIPQDDALVPAYILRGIAAIWMWAAAWHYLKHGVLQRPKTVPSKEKAKPTTAQGVLATLGCFASLGAVGVTAVVVGAWADWAYRGLSGDDATHPARRTLDAAVDAAQQASQNPDEYFGVIVAVVATLIVLRVVTAAARRGRPAPQEERARAARRKQRRSASGGTNRPEPSTSPGRPAPSSASQPGPTSAPRTSNSGRTIDDPMLGVLRRDDGAGGWRLVNPRSDIGGLLLVADGEPTSAQMDVGRSLVQRSFEALLRASEAARPLAQANGVGLPRFTVIESLVRPSDGAHPIVTMRLRCESDDARVYEVTSSDGLQTFGA